MNPETILLQALVAIVLDLISGTTISGEQRETLRAAQRAVEEKTVKDLKADLAAHEALAGAGTKK